MSVVITAFGLISLVWFGYQVIQLVQQFFRAPKNLKKFGDWSIVTGATSGIGEAIAFELAKRGQNVLLIGRNKEKLEKTRNAIKATSSGVNVNILQIDLSKMSKDNEKQFKYFIKNNRVGCLVNNAGLSYRYTRYFDEVPQQRVEDIINVNNKSPAILTQLFLKELLKKSERSKGCIINISSAGAVIPHQLHCVYSGTKSFLNKFTLDLALEYSKKGVFFQVQLPYFVVSNMSKIKKASLTIPSAKQYAKAAVDQFGYPGLCFPYPIHALIFFILRFVPEKILENVVGNMHKTVMSKGNYVNQQTYAMIKPDAIKKADEIIQIITENGFKIVERKPMQLTREKASEFYAELKEKSFFNDLIEYVTSGEVLALRLEKKNAVKVFRDLLGPTDAKKAKESAPQSIRAKYGTDIENNACHGSDSTASAKRELRIIFDDE